MTQSVSPTVEIQAPAPTFDAMPLSPDVRKAIDALGYTHPTPVQLAVFEPASRGKSLVVQARTGTGKTAAFGLPIVDTLVKKSQPGVQALILTPTRELALQVSAELERLAQFRGLKIAAVYGGAPMGRQVAQLEDGAQVVCGTPGRVLDHLRRGTLDPSNIRIFILDEADEMLSMGFAKELNAIIETLPRERQGLYFSATIPPDVERLANNHLRDPEYVTLSSDQVGALSISHFVYLVREGDKRAALARIIEVEDPESAVIFCNTKDETERVAELLKSRGFDADWLNGDLEQKERERVMNATKQGKLRFLVATDVAARGIDISHLTHVINADFPESAEHYVHRTGRTGRAGKTGTAISVVGPKDVGHLYMLRLTYKIRPIERALATQGELNTRAEADLVGFLAEAYSARTPDPRHLAVARRLLTHDASENIIAGMIADHLGTRSTDDVVQEAGDARRAKNPPIEREQSVAEARPSPARPVKKAAHDKVAPPREPVDREARTRPEADLRAEGIGTPRFEEKRSTEAPRTLRDGERPRRPVSTLASWEPPEDADDDRPILTKGDKSDVVSDARPTMRGDARRGDPSRGDPSRGSRDRGPRVGRRDAGRPVNGRREENGPDLPGITIEDGPVSAAPQTASRQEGAAPRSDDANFANVFLNVGKRDGVDAAEIHRLLKERAGLGESDVGHVRIRDRIAFVGIKKELADRAIEALIGATVGDRTVNAELARGGPERT